MRLGSGVGGGGERQGAIGQIERELETRGLNEFGGKLSLAPNYDREAGIASEQAGEARAAS